MKLRLQVNLEFLHLENALFCAEQCILAGVDTIEIGTTLLKNSGLNSVRILRDRFPEVFLIVDMKSTENVVEEVNAAATAGASCVTISGAIPLHLWERAIEAGKEKGVKVILDFRGLSEIGHKLAQGVPEVDMVFISLEGDEDKPFYSLQEIISLVGQTPLGITGLSSEEEVSQAISLGISTLIARFSDSSGKDCQEAVKNLQVVLANCEKAFPLNPVSVNEESLRKMLDNLMPADICDAVEHSVYLDRVYPIHKYTKLVGKVNTLKVWPGAHIEVLEFLLEVEPGSILVIDSGGQGSAVWGQVATEIALKRGLAGVVVYGSITDINKIRDRGFPCYTTALTSAVTSHRGMVLKNKPLQIGNVWIRPGDWLLGDDTGVVCLSASHLFSIIPKALALSEEKMKLVSQIEKAEEEELAEIVQKFVHLYNGD